MIERPTDASDRVAEDADIADEAEDPLVRRETDRAAAEAASIGGEGGVPDDVDEAERPLAEAGGGVAEGFEQAEEALVEGAEHGEGRPADTDAFTPEAEPERAVHGEADDVTEASAND